MDLTREVIATTERLAVRNYNRYPVVFVDGYGAWLVDSNGRKYLDMAAAYGVFNWGRQNERWNYEVNRQLKNFLGASGNYYSVEHANVLDALYRFCGKGKALFSCEGGVSVETAVKIVRKWGYVVKKVKGIPEIISTNKNFHGRMYGALSMSPVEKYRDGFGPFLDGIDKCVRFDDPDDFARNITDNTVAFFIEVVAGEGGIHLLPDGYLTEIRKICDKHNILLVDDEIQAGMGRTGYDLAYQHEGVIPDVIILSKALGGGVPCSVVLADDNIMNVIGEGEHGSTHGANPLSCAAALASLAILRDDNLSQRSKEMGKYLKFRLEQIKSSYIKEVRGRGLFIGVEVNATNNDEIHQFCAKLLIEEGVACLGARDNTIRFTPPLIITKEEIDEAMPKIERVFRQWMWK